MINAIKLMRKMKTSKDVLDFTDLIRKIKEAELVKDILGIENMYKSWDRIEKIAYIIAVKKATLVAELEKCAVEIGENYSGGIDPDEWAEEVRIKAYGLKWYLEQCFNSAQCDEFVRFTKETGIVNPLSGIPHVIRNNSKNK